MARHVKLTSLMTPAEKLARVAASASDVARAAVTRRSGTIYVPNADGVTGTIIGPGAGSDGTGTAQGVAPWVGDTTPPGRPTGVTATSAWGIVYVTWDGTLEGGVPADFDHVSVLVDGSEVAQMSRQGTVAVEGLTAGATVTVTLVAYDDAHARDGSPSPNASEPSEPVTATVSDERAEIDQSVQDANDRADALQQEMTDVKATVNGVEQDVSELTTKVSGAVEKADQSLSVATEAKQTADAVSTTASRAYEDAQSALTQSSSALQTAQQLKTTVEEDYLSKDDASGTYASKSDVTQTKDQILSEVSEEYQSKDGMSSYYTKTEVDQKNDAITSTVSTAQSTANSALSKASTVEQTAEGLTVRLDSAEEDIGLAQTAASNAQSSADAAKTEAQTARALANTAKTAAETAQGTAASALGTANRAQSAASAAQGAADDAAKVATNFLGFSSGGLVVGDQTGSSLGKNVLIDADSVDIRDGDTVLASYGGNNVSLGINSVNSRISFSGGTSYVGYVGNGYDPGTALLYSLRQGSVLMQVGGDLPDPYGSEVAAIGVSRVGDLTTDTGSYQIGDGSDRRRVFMRGERLYLMGDDPFSGSRADVPMSDVITVLSNGPYVKSASSTGTRIYVGSKILTLSSSFQRLFTDAEYRAIVGRSFSQNDDVVLVMNGDLGAADVRPYGTSYVPSEKAVYFNCAAGTGGASRWSWVIVRRA